MSALLLPVAYSLLAYSLTVPEPSTAEHGLEPCINGSVSNSGAFPTQSMQDEVDAYLAWRAENGRLDDLSEVAAKLPPVPPRKR
jgi:hypothetical protein